MLSAILHGKKTGSGLAGTRLKIGETQGAEDILTSSVFERIAYLPDEVFNRFIQNLLNGYDFGHLYEIEFWPYWEINNAKIEPDVVLFNQMQQTIIIEAKRYDNTQQQYAYQLANEIQAAYNNEINDPILLTVGGMYEYSVKNKKQLKKQIDDILQARNLKITYQLYVKSWQDIYLTLEQAIKEDKAQFLQRLLSDIREAYDWHDIRYKPYQWLNELKEKKITYTEYPQLIKQKNTWIQLKPINLTHEKFPSFLGEC